MELWQTILANIIGENEGELMKSDIEKLFEKECYIALEKIKAILEDDSLEDKECFEKIESIVCLFEEMGTDAEQGMILVDFLYILSHLDNTHQLTYRSKDVKIKGN